MDSRAADASRSTDRSGIAPWALAAAVLIARIPFLLPGYGVDPDAWRVAADGRAIAATGVYAASRAPGNPIVELAAALVWRGGPLALNGLTAVFGSLAVLAFTLSLRRLGVRDWVWGALALAFTPVIAVNSANAMDYLWALAFLLAAHDLALRGRALAAGVLTGLAIGCRITSVLLLPAFSLILLPHEPRGAARGRVLGLWIAAAIVGTAAYSPAIALTGLGFLHGYGEGYPPLLYVLKNMTVDVWGLIGCVALLAAAAWALAGARRRDRGRALPAVPLGFLLAWVLAIALELIVFLRLPVQAEYLIPIVPFTLLLAARGLDRNAFRALCVALILSSFALKVSEAGKPDSPRFTRASLRVGRRVLDLRGPLYTDHDRRARGVAYAESVVARAARLPRGSVVSASEWLPFIEVLAGGKRVGEIAFVYVLDPRELARHVAAGDSVYDLPGAEDYSVAVYGRGLHDQGSRPLDVGAGSLPLDVGGGP